MKKWRIWLKRTAWVAMGLVLMCGSAQMTALATDNSGEISADSKEMFITNFNLPDVAKEIEVQVNKPLDLPETLGIEVSTIDSVTQQPVPGTSRPLWIVAKTVISETETNIQEISGLEWVIDSTKDNSGDTFEPKAGNVYYYTVKLPITDENGNVLKQYPGVELPSICVKVVEAEGEEIEGIIDSGYESTVMPFAADNISDDNIGNLATPSNPDSAAVELNGLWFVGGDGTANNVKKVNNHIELEKGGGYIIQGTWKAPDFKDTAYEPFIKLASGEYWIILDKVTINLLEGKDADGNPTMGSAYYSIFEMQPSTILHLRTSENSKATLIAGSGTNDPGKADRGIVSQNLSTMGVSGQLDIYQGSNITFQGELDVNKEMTVHGGSTVTIKGPMKNAGTIKITDNEENGNDPSTVSVYTLENSGTLNIDYESTLNVNGILDNKKTVTVDNGGKLNVNGRADAGVANKFTNSGTIAITNAGVVTAGDVENSEGSKLTINGKDENNSSTLTVSGKLTNKSDLTLENYGKVNAATIDNQGTLELKSGTEGKRNGSTVVITDFSQEIQNTGTIDISAESIMKPNGRDVSLYNAGKLRIGGTNCLGSAESGLVKPYGPEEAEFILTGLEHGMIQRATPSEPLAPLELDYTGKDQTESVTGQSRLDAGLGDEGEFHLVETWDVNDCDFTVDVKVNFDKGVLNRNGKTATGSAGANWSPGVTAATDKAVNTIEEPGVYTLTYVNAAFPGQSCTIEVYMSEYSFRITGLKKGTDTEFLEGLALKDGHNGDIYGDIYVYDYDDTISGTVEVAIFNASKGEDLAGTSGQIVLHFDMLETERNGTDVTTRAGIEERIESISLDDKGCGTATFNIKTSSTPKNNQLMALYDDKNLDDEVYTYQKSQYRLIAWCELGGMVPNSGSGATADDSCFVPQTSYGGKVTDWYDGATLIVKRPKANIGFSEAFRDKAEARPREYNREPFELPTIGTNADVNISPNTNYDIDWKWYQGTEQMVDAAIASGDTKGLDLVNWQEGDTEKYPEPEAAGTYPPKNAGYYVLEITAKSTTTMVKNTALQKVVIKRADVAVEAKGLSKIYGAKDPNWSDIEEICKVTPGEAVEELSGFLSRETGEDCGTYTLSSVLTSTNYNVKFTPNVLTIKKRQLDWDTSKMVVVKTEDGFSVVGGLSVQYQETDNDGEIEELFQEDSIGVDYTCLSWNMDENKVTVVGSELSGNDQGNYDKPMVNPIPLEGIKQYTLEVKTSIDANTVENVGMVVSALDSADKIKSAMENEVLNQGARSGNVAVYDILVRDSNGNLIEDDDEFPWGGLTITVPYPANTSKESNAFVAAHMFTMRLNKDGKWYNPGSTENPAIIYPMTEEGIRFQVSSLSPISIGWSQVTNPGGNNNGNNNNNQNGGNGTTGDPNNPNGGNNNTNNGNTNNNNTNNNNTNNKATNSNSTKATNSNTTRTSGVRTGDTAEIAFYMIATLIACLLLILIICLIRMQFKKKE